LDVTLIDISAVALEMAGRAAHDRGLDLELIQADLRTEPVPAGPWDLVVCLNYLQRPLLPALASVLAHEGIFVVELATRTNLEQHDRPPLEFLLDEGEILTLLRDVEILEHDEDWHDGRHVARVVAGPRVG
jgi:SAM-dependent methyltransferase